MKVDYVLQNEAFHIVRKKLGNIEQDIQLIERFKIGSVL